MWCNKCLWLPMSSAIRGGCLSFREERRSEPESRDRGGRKKEGRPATHGREWARVTRDGDGVELGGGTGARSDVSQQQQQATMVRGGIRGPVVSQTLVQAAEEGSPAAERGRRSERAAAAARIEAAVATEWKEEKEEVCVVELV
ncbi:hypothetical protein Syun_019333 [Stephania yunnanensis]|uniref:Uncharacterized protein n=1 Tax=Stephania yunnanensis TaxID=152371 RepID=A0AAP0ITZ2_9MAGN